MNRANTLSSILLQSSNCYYLSLDEKENISGFIAAAPTVSSFAKALETAWESKSEWKQMGNAAFEQTVEILEADPHIKIYELLKD